MRATVGIKTTLVACAIGASISGFRWVSPLVSPRFTASPHATESVDHFAPATAMQSMTRALAGRWSTRIRLEAPSGKPPLAEQRGEELWQAAAGGTVLLQDEHFVAPSIDMHLLGIIWWDGKTQDFHGMECNDQNAHSCDLLGAMKDITIHWDGKQLLIEELEGPRGGHRTMYHETISGITDSSFTQTGDSGPIGGPFARMFTIYAMRSH